ncbi:MAG: hypothetical protein KC591_10430 [Gemmatimonadetes bacterium]|nr:hypothetical protein [Gemmatimonadota bacterium]
MGGEPAHDFLSEDDDRLLDRTAQAVVRWGMSVPAIFMLESSKPLSFVGSQFLHFLSPIVHTVFNAKELDQFAKMLERRETIEELIRRIERAEDDARSATKG